MAKQCTRKTEDEAEDEAEAEDEDEATTLRAPLSAMEGSVRKVEAL
jgi:hypothetical protein